MSDKVYLPSVIPDGFEYAQFSNGVITLYNQSSVYDDTIEYYKIHYDYSSGLVTHGYQTFGAFTTDFEQVDVSREFFDRPDCMSIVFIVLTLSIFGLWVFNLMTSLVKRGGLLGGLL